MHNNCLPGLVTAKSMSEALDFHPGSLTSEGLDRVDHGSRAEQQEQQQSPTETSLEEPMSCSQPNDVPLSTNLCLQFLKQQQAYTHSNKTPEPSKKYKSCIG